MTILITLMTLTGLWAAWSLFRGVWSIVLPRSAWKWDRGSEFKGAEPSFFGLVAQVGRGFRAVLIGAGLGALSYGFYYLAYGHPQNFTWPLPWPGP